MQHKDYAEMTALMSESQRYRYCLTRVWDKNKKNCLFIMLNPSTADAQEDDQTIKRCVGFAKSWDYGSLTVVNLFAHRATDKSEIQRVSDPTGKENDFYILESAKKAARIICAWGNDGGLFERSRIIKRILQENGFLLYYLELSKKGEPKHPLYVKGNALPQRFVQ